VDSTVKIRRSSVFRRLKTSKKAEAELLPRIKFFWARALNV